MRITDEIARRRQGGHDVVSLCAGEPSARPTPETLKPAGYTGPLGTMPVREAIAGHYRGWYGIEVDPKTVAVTTGSSGAFQLVFLTAFDAGDRVALATPGYPAYANILRALGVQVVEIPTGIETRYQPTPELLDAAVAEHGALSGLIVSSPANPTGTMLGRAELTALVEWCRGSGVRLISDEIYHGITFGQEATSSWQTSTSGVVVGSLSKYYSMTGWRIGWAVLPTPLVRSVELLLGNLHICAPALGQVAAVEAFSADARAELDGHVARYRVNRDHVLARLPELGVSTWAPADGAFYAYADISHLTDDSTSWCGRVLDATGVAITPGVDFAPHRPGVDSPLDGSRWFRLSVAGATADVDEALTRLATFVAHTPS